MQHNSKTRTPYFCIPKVLLSAQYADLSPPAVLLMGILMDRLSLSVKNGEAWCDRDGNTFVYLTNQEACELLHCGKQKASQVFRDLEKHHLIRRVVTGQGHPTRIYPVSFTDFLAPAEDQTGEPDSSGLEDDFPSPNNTNIENQIYHPELHNVNAVEQKVKKMISFEVLARRYSVTQVQCVVEAIAFVLTHKASTIYIAGRVYPTREIQEAFAKLDDMRVCYVLDCMKTEHGVISNVKGYILARLSDSPNIVDAYYDCRVQREA